MAESPTASMCLSAVRCPEGLDGFGQAVLLTVLHQLQQADEPFAFEDEVIHLSVSHRLIHGVVTNVAEMAADKCTHV